MSHQNTLVCLNFNPEVLEDSVEKAGVLAELVAEQERVDRGSVARPPIRSIGTHGEPLLSSGAFVSGFTPPDYLLYGVLQCGFLYSITGATGSGKTAFLLLLAHLIEHGKDFDGRETKRGKVIYLAGENADDVRMRWIAMAEHYGFSPNKREVYFLAGAHNLREIKEQLERQIERLGGVVAIIVDTSAAYFHSDPENTDENDNGDALRWAKQLRNLTQLQGNPAVLVAAHPVKTATPLLPRGGGAFLAEVDGNLVVRPVPDRAGIVDVRTEGKFRGHFEPFSFMLNRRSAPQLRDSKGRSIETIVAEPMAGHDRKLVQEMLSGSDEADLLEYYREHGTKGSLRTIATMLGWKLADGKPNKQRVDRAKKKLQARGRLTPEGMLSEKASASAL